MTRQPDPLADARRELRTARRLNAIAVDEHLAAEAAHRLAEHQAKLTADRVHVARLRVERLLAERAGQIAEAS